MLLTHWLVAEGHSVVGAGSANAAIGLLGKRPFDVVITDILMPEGDGLDLISAIKAMPTPPRIVAISGGGRYLEGENCLKLARGWGAHAAVMKPLSREQLLAALVTALAVRPSGDAS